MGTSKAEGKRSLKAMEEEEEDQDEDDNITGSHSGLMFVEDHEKIRKKGKRGFSTSSDTSGPNISCQVDDCGVDMTDAKRYHKRHKVCEFHAKSAIVCVSGLHQRFCQQCSRFHEVTEFDDAKRSCRRRLAGHNERRRRSSSENHGEGSN